MKTPKTIKSTPSKKNDPRKSTPLTVKSHVRAGKFTRGWDTGANPGG